MSDSNDSNSPFIIEAKRHIHQAQAGVADLFFGVGLGGARPAKIERVLGLDKTLAWRVSRFSDATDPLKAVKLIPGTNGLAIVLKAAREHGASDERVHAVHTADQALREFIQHHAGDQRSFEAMLAAEGRDHKVELEERRAYYRSGSAIWGVRAKAQFLSLCLRPSSTNSERVDMLQMGGFIGLERLRPDVPWIIRRLWKTDTEGTAETDFRREPLYPLASAGKSTLAVMPEFCTQPLPQIDQVTGPNGGIYDEIAPGSIGKRGAVTCVTGEIYHSVLPLNWSQENPAGHYHLTLRTPVEIVVFDIYLHKSMAHFSDYEYSICGLLEDRLGISPGNPQGSPLYKAVPALKLGSPPVTKNTQIPNYSTMLAKAVDVAGWGTINDFRGYRCKIEYPATPWRLTMTCQIAPPA